MARNTELVRQWEILREIDSSRAGVSIARLAAQQRVHPRTIRRDMDALSRAGFPLYDEKINGTSMWKLRAKPFRSLEEPGLGVVELCALYSSKSMMLAQGGTPLRDDVERALMKLEGTLPATSRRPWKQLPGIVVAKGTGRKKQDARRAGKILARAVEALLSRRRVEMRYASTSSGYVRDYVVEPLRVCYADGGIYIRAWVPEYGQKRTFALERIRTLAVRDEHFPERHLPPEPFAHSLGVHDGTPELVEIEFGADVASYVKEREWHGSQEIAERSDGTILLRLCVCDDPPLRRWIRGFGPTARVVTPKRLAHELFQDAEMMRQRYAPRLRVEMLKMLLPDAGDSNRRSDAAGESEQPSLPFRATA